jgi:hypothetical protein
MLKSMLYRKKPIKVEANQWFPELQEAGKPRIPEKYGVRYCPPNKVDLSATRGIIVDRPGRYVIDTLEGVMEVSPGDWIIKGIKGERYPVKPYIFELTYEPARRTDKHTSKIGWLFNRWRSR